MVLDEKLREIITIHSAGNMNVCAIFRRNPFNSWAKTPEPKNINVNLMVALEEKAQSH